MDENKAGSYLKYAIGEIVLVVVGILIALQINNWNENRISQNEEIKLLQNFKNSIESDHTSVSYFIEEFGTINNSINFIIKHIKDDLPFEKSLNFHFLNSTAYWEPGIDQGIFSTLTSNDLNIITNDSLKKEIVNYYAFVNRSFEPLIIKYQRVIEDASKNLFNTRFDMLWNTKEKAMIPHNYESLKKDKAYNYFINSLKNQIFWLMIDPLNKAEIKAKNLITIIDKELKVLKK